MKKYQKVNGGFTKLSDENLLILAETVMGAISSNPYFPNPEPSLDEVEPVLEDFREKLATARRRGSPYETAEKNAAREIMERKLSELAFYVNKTAQGNLPVLLSSGFEVSKFRRSVLPPEKIWNLRVTDGSNSGQMVLNFDPQIGTRLYEFRFTDEKDEHGELLWNKKTVRTSSSRNNLIQNLVPGRIYFLSARYNPKIQIYII